MGATFQIFRRILDRSLARLGRPAGRLQPLESNAVSHHPEHPVTHPHHPTAVFTSPRTQQDGQSARRAVAGRWQRRRCALVSAWRRERRGVGSQWRRLVVAVSGHWRDIAKGRQAPAARAAAKVRRGQHAQQLRKNSCILFVSISVVFLACFVPARQ